MADPTADSATSDSKWNVAKNVLHRISLSNRFNTLRDRCGDNTIEASQLQAISVLGEGAFATVEKAWYTPAGGGEREIVAVKRLKPEIFSEPEDFELFVKEVALMRKLHNKHIVNFIGVGTLSDTEIANAFVVQEYMAGGTLKSLVTKQMMMNPRPLYSDVDAIDICLQIAQGLRYMHDAIPMVIHRDLKLENILLASDKPGPDGKYLAKVADFGLSASVNSKRQKALGVRASSMMPAASLPTGGLALPETASSGALAAMAALNTAASVPPPSTKAETLKATLSFANSSQSVSGSGGQKFDLTTRTGSLMYMSPEVFLEHPYNEKADVFSFGVILYEVLHKYIMLSSVSVLGTFEELVSYAGRVAAGSRPHIHDHFPPDLRQLIADCWAQDPAQRPSMRRVVERLEAIAASGELSAAKAKAKGSGGDGGGCCSVM